jgi:hypothetical protein
MSDGRLTRDSMPRRCPSARRTCDQSREVLSDALSFARATGYPDLGPADQLEAAEQPA